MRKPRLTVHIPARSPHLLLIPQAAMPASDENRLAAHPLCIVGSKEACDRGNFHRRVKDKRNGSRRGGFRSALCRADLKFLPNL